MSKQDAIALFTDRTEPQAAFASAYLAMTQQSDSFALTYYGMGGIGKSTLLAKLEHNLSNDPQLSNVNKGKPLVVYFNFERHQEDIKVLMSLRNMLGTKYKWKFPRFELGLYLYSQNIGEDADAPEDTGYLEKAGLKPAVEIAGEIPILGSVLKAISILDQGQAAVRTLMKQHSAMVKEFEELSAEEQREALPALFAADLNTHTQKAKSPLVVMLDTFECVTETSGTGDSLYGRDYWLHGENGLIPTAKNALFVIAGRNKLRWKPEGFAMEQYPLGALAPEDAVDYLTAAGVPEALHDHLCQLTDGVPVYLDVCARQYRQLVRKNITPEKEHFGGSSDVLIRRYVRYMDKNEKELVRLLSFLPEWDQELVRQASQKVLGSFSLADYNRVVKLSIISESDKGRYFIHRTVADILQKDPENSLREATATFLIDHCKAILDTESPYSDSYTDAAGWLLAGGMLLHEDRDALVEFYHENMETALDTLNIYRRRDPMLQIAERYWAKAQEVKEDRLYAAAQQEHLWRRFQHSGVSLELLEQALESLKLHTRLRGEQNLETLRVLSMTTIFLEVNKQYADSIPLYEYLIHLLELHHPDKQGMILNARRNIAIAYSYLKKYDQALPILQKLVDDYREKKGPEHRSTLRAMRDLALCHRNLEAYTEARQWGEESLELCRQVLTDKHPDTRSALSALAITCKKMGDDAQETELLTELLLLCDRDLKENDSETLSALISLGNNLTRRKEYGQAVKVRKLLWERYAKYYGENHPKTIDTARYLQRSYMDAEDYGQALELLQRLLAWEQAQKPIRKFQMNNLYKDMTLCYEKQGMYREALQAKADTLWFTYKNSFSGFKLNRAQLDEFDEECLQLDMPETALSLHQRLYQWLCHTKTSTHPSTYDSLGRLMRAYKRAGKEEAARSEFRSAVARLEAAHGADPHYLTVAKIRLGAALCLMPETLSLAWPLLVECFASYNPIFEDEYNYCYIDGAYELDDLFTLAQQLVAVREYEKALAVYAVLQKYPPEYEEPYTITLAIAEIFDRMGRKEDAIRLERQAAQEKAKSEEPMPDWIKNHLVTDHPIPPTPPQAPPAEKPWKNNLNRLPPLPREMTHPTPSKKPPQRIESYLGLSWQEMLDSFQQKVEALREQQKKLNASQPIPPKPIPNVSLAELMELVKKEQEKNAQNHPQ